MGCHTKEERMKPILLHRVAGISLLVLLTAGTVSAEDQGWINHSLTLKVNARISLKVTQEARHREITFADAYLRNWQGGVIWKASSRIQLAAYYKRESSDALESFIHENRFTVDGVWDLPVNKDSRFDVRFRTEIREFEDGLKEDHLRFRLRLRFRTRFSLGGLTLKPFLAVEPFADTLADKINRNRLYLGFGVPLTAHAQWVVNYIRQDTSGKETVHILNTGVDLKF